MKAAEKSKIMLKGRQQEKVAKFRYLASMLNEKVPDDILRIRGKYQKVLSFQRDNVRRILNVREIDKMKNECLKGLCGVPKGVKRRIYICMKLIWSS